MRYVIYQVPDAETPCTYFLGQGLHADEVGMYRSVWSGDVATGRAMDVLDELHRILSVARPNGYRARCLSCGDVIGLYDGAIWSYWYLSMTGFENVTDVFRAYEAAIRRRRLGA